MMDANSRVPDASARTMAREVDTMLGLVHWRRAREVTGRIANLTHEPSGPDEGVNHLITSLIGVNRAEKSRREEETRSGPRHRRGDP